MIEGNLCEPIVQGLDGNLAYLTFYLPNFRYFNNPYEEEEEPRDIFDDFIPIRLTIKFDKWRIIIANPEKASDTESRLRSQGGYALNHHCKIERIDRGIFSVGDVRDLLEALSYYLSFARGIWTAPMIMMGFNTEGTKVWEEWSTCKADSWQNVGSWCDFTSCYDLVKAFPGFMRRWEDKNWRALVKESVHWYIEVNKKYGGVNAAIALQQIALERLAWAFLVDDKRAINPGGFEKLPAADKIKLLLTMLNIELEIPDRATKLLEKSKEYNWNTGPDAIAEIRNAIVHYNPKRRDRSGSDEVRDEACGLGLKYLGMVLLKLFDCPQA
ncbi:MAG: hypothetical protein F6J93_02525 [Oscillatoria sp. SIO1A7]|nr:hypothetical protein [Oscillatoria sp. SIO1A7]